MRVRRPKTADDYIDLIKNARFEVDELRASLEYDLEGLGGDALKVAEELDVHISDIYKSMQDGSYEFEDKDLPFMTLVRSVDSYSLPFKDLLNIINETHRKGLAVGDEE